VVFDAAYIIATPPAENLLPQDPVANNQVQTRGPEA
jgi:hypothetical protein